MAIKKVTVTDGTFTLWVKPESNTISIRRNDGRPLDEIDYRADDLYDYYKRLMNDPASVSPDLENIILKKDRLDGTFITLTVYTCGHYTVRRKELKRPKRSPLWKFFCH